MGFFYGKQDFDKQKQRFQEAISSRAKNSNGRLHLNSCLFQRYIIVSDYLPNSPVIYFGQNTPTDTLLFPNLIPGQPFSAQVTPRSSNNRSGTVFNVSTSLYPSNFSVSQTSVTSNTMTLDVTVEKGQGHVINFYADKNGVEIHNENVTFA